MSDTRECVIRSPHGVCGRRLADTPSLVCLHHEAALREALSDVAEMWALLPFFDLPGSVASDGGKQTKRPDAPIPLRLDRIALTDRRNGPAIGSTEWGQDVPDVPGTLASWARLAAEERDVPLPDDTSFVLPAVQFLRRHLLWLVEQDWIDDLEEEIRGLRRAVAQAVGAPRPPKPLQAAVCSAPTATGTCGGPLIPADDHRSIRCGRCKEVTDENMLAFLGEKWAGSLPALIDTAEAARLAGVGTATIRQWAHRGKLARAAGDRWDRDEVLALMAMKTA